MALLVSGVLRFGVALAAGVTTLGLALLIWNAWNARGLLHLGVLILIATPVARVAFMVVAFARAKDVLYTGVALVVLVLLAIGLLGPSL
jgi:uncharacterized membrane protein